MRSYQGLGFAFEGEDDGLDRQLNQTIRGFRAINDLIPTMGKEFTKTGQSSTSFKDNLMGMKTGFDAMTSGGNLTTSLEGQIVSMDKELRRMGRNAGYTGKELTKFKSGAMGLAMSFKVSEEAAAEAQIGWEKAQKELQAVGINSRADLLKYANVSGQSAKEFVTSLKTMRKEFQMTDSGLSRVVGAFQQLGQVTGSVDTTMQDMPKILDLMRKRARGLGKDLPEDQLAGFAEQTANLAGIMYKLTGDSTKAREAAFAIGQTMVDGRQQFLDMFAGLQNTMPDAMQSVAKSFGDVGVSMDMLKQGPSEFIAAMGQAVINAKKQGKDISEPLSFIEGQLGKTFGPEQAQMMSAIFRNATQAEIDQLKVTKKATAELGKYAREGFTAGWTLAESFDRAKDVLEMNFRSIGRSAATDMVKTSQVAFKEFSDDLKALAARGGPMGSVITKMSEMSSIGGVALVPKALRPMAVLTGTITEKMAPMLQTMHQVVGIFPALIGGFSALRGLLSIKGILLTGLVAFGAYLFTLSKAGESATKVLGKVADVGYNLLEGFAGVLEKIPSFIDDVDNLLSQFFNNLDSAVQSSSTENRWLKLGKRLLDGFGKVFWKLGSTMWKVVEGLWQGLTKQIDPKENPSGFQRIGLAIGSAVRGAWDWAVNYIETVVWPGIKNFAMGFFNRLNGFVDPSVDATGAGQLGIGLANAVTYAWDWLLDKAPAVWAAIENFAIGMWDGFWGKTVDPATQGDASQLGTAVGGLVGDGLKWGVKKLIGFLGENPAAAALIGFAAGGPVGGLMVGSIAAAVHTSRHVLGVVSKEEGDLVLKRLTEAVRAVGHRAGISFNQAMADGMQQSSKEFADMGWVGEKLQESLKNSVQGALKKESLFMLNSASDIDKRWREHGMMQMTAYVSQLDKVRSAWSSTFKVSNAEALQEIQRSLDDGTFMSKMATVEQKGYLTDLKLEFKYTAEEQAQMAARSQASWKAIETAGVGMLDSLATKGKDTYAALTSGADSYASSAKSKLLGLVGMKSTPSAAPAKQEEAPDLKLAKFDKKEYRGYRDMISKETEKVAKHLGEPTKKLVEEVLISAFQNAYKKVDLDTRTFAKTETEVLGKMAKDVTSALGDMWKKILEQTAIATEAMTKDVSYITGSLKSVESAFSAMNLARSAAMTVTATDGATLADREFKSTSYEGQLLEATRWPDWYDDYKKIFVEQLALLVTAVQGITAVTAPSNYSSASGAAAKTGPFNAQPAGLPKKKK